MTEVRRLASMALAKRAEVGIKVRQPLQKIKIQKLKFKIGKQLLDILKDEINVKEVIVDKKIKEEIELDTEITHELKEEGWLRDFIRMVQDLRQDAKLEPKDKVILLAELPPELNYAVQKNEKLVKKEINVKAIEYKRSEKFNIELETKLEEWPVWLGLRRI